jgi:hypothetical protein
LGDVRYTNPRATNQKVTNRVVSQDPPAGRAVAPNTRVNILIDGHTPVIIR